MTVRISDRLDGWENSMTGFGTSRDKTTYATHITPCRLLDVELESLFNYNDIAARMVELIPDECFREGFELEIDKDAKDTAKSIMSAWDVLDATAKIKEADTFGRLFGGCMLVLGADDGQPADKPLQIDRIRTLDFLEAIDRRYMQPRTFYSRGPKSGSPETYTLSRPGHGFDTAMLFEIHESRMIRFGGNQASFLERQRLNYWDHSVLQRPYETIRSFDSTFKAVEILIADGRQGVYKVKNLISLLGAQGYSKLQERMAAVDLTRSALRAIVVDADQEDFTQSQVSFAGLPEVLQMFMLRLASSVRMPVTILMGQSPAGMNSTGDSDFRWFYDQIATRQSNYLEPKVRRLLDVMCSAADGPTAGKPVENLEIEWCSLWTPTAKESAEIDKLKADTAAVYVGADVVTPEEVALGPSFPGDYAIERETRELTMQAQLAAAKSPVGDVGLNPDLVTPTDRATVITVDEARAAAGLGPDPDPKVGTLKLAEYRALLDAQATDAQAELTSDASKQSAAAAAKAAANPPAAPGATPPAKPGPVAPPKLPPR